VTFVRAGHASTWDVLFPVGVRAGHVADWSINTPVGVRAGHADAWDVLFPVMVRAGHTSVYDVIAPVSVRSGHSATWSIIEIIRNAVRTGHTAPWRIVQEIRAGFIGGYEIGVPTRVRAGFQSGYALLDSLSLQAIANQPELIHDGRVIRIEEATLSCDEDSPVWIARFVIPDIEAFALMGVRDPLRLDLGAETFNLVIDGKTLSRESPGNSRCEVSAISPVALLESPFAAGINIQPEGATAARAFVESLIGPVTWSLPEWIIPAERLAFDGVTPLYAARTVVQAVGGLIESAPDGTVICRSRHPASVPDYATAPVAHRLTDRDIIGLTERIAPMRGFNRMTVANEQAGGDTPDDLEYVGTDSSSGILRATLSTLRPVRLVHTGHPETAITRTGTVIRNETEVVEFVQGRGRTRYPVAGIINRQWKHSDLGGITASDRYLTSAVAGNSLLEITYAVQTINWRVSGSQNAQVQFVLENI